MSLSRFPIKYFEDNLIFNIHGDVFAFYEIGGYSYAYQSVSDKLALHKKLEQFMLSAPDNIQLLMIPQDINLSCLRQYLEQDVSPDCLEIGYRQVELSLSYLEGRGIYKYRYFIGIKLSVITSLDCSRWREWRYIFSDFKRYLLKSAGVDDHVTFQEELEIYKHEESQIYNYVSSELGAKRLSNTDVEWLIRRGFYRSIGDVPLREDWHPEFNNEGLDLLTLAEGRFDNLKGRGLSIEQYYLGEFRTGFISFLSLAHMPDQKEFPGMEWLYALNSLPFPIEVSVRTKQHEYGSFLSQFIDRELDLSRSGIGADRTSIFKTSVSFGISASNEQVLNLRIQMIRDLYKSMNIEMAIPYGEQWDAFNDFIPGVSGYATDYLLNMSSSALAAGMFAADTHMGHDVGFVIGASEMSPVLFKHEPSQSILFVGSSESGKSFAANIMAYQALLHGAQVLIFDAGDDRSNWIRNFPELKKISRCIRLGANDSKYEGILDPFLGVESLADKLSAAEIAKRIFQVLASVADGTYESIIIGKAVDFVTKHEQNPSMYKILNSLSEGIEWSTDSKHEHLQVMIANLRELSNSERGLLLFSEHGASPLDFSTHLLTILQIEDVTPIDHLAYDEHRASLAVAMGVAELCRKFYKYNVVNPNIKSKVVLFEEADQLLNVRECRSVMNDLGGLVENSSDLSLYLTSHKGQNLPEDIQFSYKLLFRMPDLKLAGSAVQLLDLGSDEDILNQVVNLPQGTCFIQDNSCRVNKIKIKALDDFSYKFFSRGSDTATKTVTRSKEKAGTA